MSVDAGTELLGLVAGTLTTISFVPQVLKVWRSRSAADISLAMFLLFTVGVLLWGIYGVLIGSLAVIVANVVTFVLTVGIIAMKLRWG
jgi:MtN3 and saliva related transmembrane protein